jgi:hypothetical protein
MNGEQQIFRNHDIPHIVGELSLASEARVILPNPDEEEVLSISNGSNFHSALEALDKERIRISRRYDYDPKSGNYTRNIRTLLFLPHETCEYSDDNIQGVEVSTSAVAVEAECDTSSGMLLLFKLSPDTKYTREESRDLTAKDLVFGHNCLYGGFITEKGVQWMRFVDTGKRIAVTECTEKNKRDLNLDLDKFLNSRTDKAES